MGPAREDHRDIAVFDLDSSFALYEVPKQLVCVTFLETPELSRQHGIECIGNHCHQHVEVDLDQNR